MSGKGGFTIPGKKKTPFQVMLSLHRCSDYGAVRSPVIYCGPNVCPLHPIDRRNIRSRRRSGNGCVLANTCIRGRESHDTHPCMVACPQREEAEAAAMYDDFVDSFKVNGFACSADMPHACMLNDAMAWMRIADSPPSRRGGSLARHPCRCAWGPACGAFPLTPSSILQAEEKVSAS